MAKNTVIVSILGDTRDLQSKLGGATGSLSKWGAAAAAAAAVTAAAIGAGVAKSVKSASELQQNLGAMDSVFKGNAAQMQQWASGAAGAVGLAKSEYAGLATVLGSQLRNMGVESAALAGKTNELIGLGADLSAQFGGSTSDAVSALSSLLRGERDPIERYGVSINEAAVQAKMAEMGLTGLTGEAEKNAKLQATLALLYQQTADAQGAFARESTTLAGAQQRLAAGAENLFATFGTALLPAFTAVTAAAGVLLNKLQGSDWFAGVTASITGASNAFADFVFGLLNGTATLDFGALFAGLLPAVISGVQAAAGWIAGGGLNSLVAGLTAGRGAMLDGAVQLFTALAQALPMILPALLTAVLGFVTQLVAQLATFVPQLLNAGVQMFTQLITALVTVIPSILTTLVTLLPGLLTTLLGMIPVILGAAVQVFTQLVAAIPVIIPPLIEAVVGLLPQLVASIVSMLPGILQGAIELFTALVQALPIILPTLLMGILNLLPSILSSVISMIPALINGAVQLFTGIVQALPKIIPQLISALIGLAPTMISTLIGLVPQLIRAGVDLIGGLVKGLMQAAGSVGSALLEIAQNAVGDFLSFLGIHSPSRLFMGFGKNTVQGLVLGLTRNAGLVDGAMGALSSRVGDGFSPVLTTPEIDSAFNSYSAARSSSAGAAPVYQISLSTLNATAETGRVIVEAIRDYEDAGGRL
ncbi:tape measure protein [Microbacterium phage Sippinontea]|nr:tape measure protein [Microbacterium phage KayPaulus]QOI67288.1 tape measure protein [Microbacterium phage Sippinontea]QRI45132.1 tape measure protein [Microbacterium phage Wolfpack]WNY14967.1 tape measure protein [Microbacterium phage Douggie]